MTWGQDGILRPIRRQYRVRDGQVTCGGKVIHSAQTAQGDDLERFERALVKARKGR